MLGVGILAVEPVWEEYLNAFSRNAPFRITKRVSEWEHDHLVQEDWLQESDVLWIPKKHTGGIVAAIQSLRQSRHVLLGFPVLEFQKEACQIVQLAREAHVDVQVGHHDRFHPAFRAVQDTLVKPQLIRIEHHTEISGGPHAEQFFMQSLLYDVDAILALISGPLKKIRAHLSQVALPFGRAIDVRLEFHNGSVALIHLSNLGKGRLRIIEVIGHQSEFKIDLVGGESFITEFKNGVAIQSRLWPVQGLLGLQAGEEIDEESLTRECVSFFYQKQKNDKPLASIEEGFEALQITQSIMEKIRISQ